MTIAERERAQRQRLANAGQEHVLRAWSRLDDAGRERLLAQVEALDLELVARLAQKLGSGSHAAGEPAGEGDFQPPPVFPLRRDAVQEAAARRARERGEQLLRAGRVAFVLVAGGQASRLGYEGPKGAFPIGPVSGRTLFEIHARRLRAAQQRWGAPTPWYVMTSEANDAATRAFFEEHGHFGLEPADVTFFSQAMLPALDDEGRILLAAPDRIFLAPNGHGGSLAALATSGALADMARRGVETISYFQVDNPLARMTDPLFLGLHAEEGAGMSTKVVPKRDPAEKVGVIGRVDGRMGCIEYSDLPEELRGARTPTGELLFNAGNIALHAIERAFVEELTRGGLQLPWHLARKSVRVVDEHGKPTEVAGTKFETFVFDALGRTETSVTLEVERSHEFSPVKNAEGEDSPQTSQRDLCRLFAGWARAAGAPLPPPDPELGEPRVEVDPLVAETHEEFVARTPKPREAEGGHLYDAT